MLLVFSGCQNLQLAMQNGCFATETGEHVIEQVKGVRRDKADGVSILHNLQVGAAGVAFFGEAGGGSSGLSGSSGTSGGT